ncbi:MAG: hypothetical protein HXY22_05025 [Alphaproteobacteria bacterium]|nr:hypothetical protein [Alphaproteobacteria bacterium]
MRPSLLFAAALGISLLAGCGEDTSDTGSSGAGSSSGVVAKGNCTDKSRADAYWSGFVKDFAAAHKAGAVTFEQYSEMMTRMGTTRQRADLSGDYNTYCAEIEAAYSQYKIPPVANQG